jgi:hypothetical protein
LSKYAELDAKIDITLMPGGQVRTYQKRRGLMNRTLSGSTRWIGGKLGGMTLTFNAK